MSSPYRITLAPGGRWGVYVGDTLVAGTYRTRYEALAAVPA